MRQLVVVWLGVLAVQGCVLFHTPPPVTLTRPAHVEADALSCAKGALHGFGYMITAGDRSLGFLRGERTRGQTGLTHTLETDVLVVNFVLGDSGPAATAGEIHVKASRMLDEEGEGRFKVGPSDATMVDAQRLLDRCGMR